MNRLAIVEDNLDFSRNLLNYIVNENKEIKLCRLSVGGDEIWEDIEELGGDDIIIIDLGLENISGIEVIHKLVQRKTRVPYIIAMSGNSELIKELRKYDKYIFAFIEKPFAFTRMIKMIEEITNFSKQNNYERIAKRELGRFEVNTITIGYQYILEAIVFSLEDEKLLKDMKNLLYKRISMNYDYVSTLNIKWAIEKSIQSIRRYTPSKIMNEYFHLTKKEKLTPKLFISTIVHNLKTERIEQKKLIS